MSKLDVPTELPPLLKLRDTLLSHTIYDSVDSIPRLRTFMESHVFAVWDFMSLLKRLQADLCPTTLPWTPPKDAAAARFINEIVIAEESDLDPDGEPTSHLGIYLRAMEEVGADSSAFRAFLAKVNEGSRVDEALASVEIHPAVRTFVEGTMSIAEHGNTVQVAAAFLHGREDPIPAMFSKLLNRLRLDSVQASRFSYYLDRHVELDGDSHGPMGQQLIERLTADNPQSALESQQMAAWVIAERIDLWTGIEEAVRAAAPGQAVVPGQARSKLTLN